MVTRTECARVEALAGAIALGEADEAQRNEYRAHLATCARCCLEFGGEREIERVMAVATRAQDAERWTPDLRHARGQARRPWYAWTFAAAVGVIAILVLIFGVRLTQKQSAIVTASKPAISSSAQADRAVAALNTQIAPRREHQAESLAFGGTGTMRFELSIDGRGMPKRCTIVKSSGYRALDQAVCRAALHAKP